VLIATQRSNGLGYRTPQGRRLSLVPKRRRGMGDCAQTGSVYNGVPYCRDNATGSLVPCSDAACGPAGVTPSNFATYVPAGPANFATMPFGNSSTTTFTLDSYLQARVASITGESTLSLMNEGIRGPGDLPATIAQLAQQYCTAEGPPDCGNINALVAKYSAIAVAAFANVPASQWNPATFTAYAYSGPQSAPPQGSPAGSGSGGSSSSFMGSGQPSVNQVNISQGAPVSVSMKNLTRPGSDAAYQVGDQWQLTLTGAPGTAISGGASQNGKSLGVSNFGALNAQGQMVLTGTMAAAQVGTWSETWNGAPLSFTVTAAAGGSQSGAGSSGESGGGSNTQQPAGGGFALPAMPDLSSLPSWTWYALGGLVLWMVVKK